MWPMLSEREPLVGLIERKFDSLGIDGLLFDLDDTLLETAGYITRFKADFSLWAANKLRMPADEVMAIFSQASMDAFEKLMVKPERWDLAVQMTAERITGEAHYLDEGIGMLKLIFTGSPELIAGARPVLELLQKTGRKMAIVTHAPKNGWTETKLRQTGIEQYFEGVWIAGDSRLKGRVDWEAGAAMIGVPHTRILGFGDSVKADIWPMAELSMRVMALTPKWIGAKGELPAGVPILKSLVEAPEAILAL